MKKLRRFLDRIGKIVYRNDNGCKCLDCIRNTAHGIQIFNKQHAELLYDAQYDYAREGIELNYRDYTKESIPDIFNEMLEDVKPKMTMYGIQVTNIGGTKYVMTHGSTVIRAGFPRIYTYISNL